MVIYVYVITYLGSSFNAIFHFWPWSHYCFGDNSESIGDILLQFVDPVIGLITTQVRQSYHTVIWVKRHKKKSILQVHESSHLKTIYNSV